MAEFNEQFETCTYDFARFLNDLHGNLLPHSQGGELTFGEIESSGLSLSSHSWARATFSDGELSELIYVKPTQETDRVSSVQSYVFTPDSPLGQQFVHVVETLRVNDVRSDNSRYMEDVEAIAEEILDFLTEATIHRVQASAESKAQAPQILEITPARNAGEVCLKGLRFVYRAVTFRRP